MANHGYTKEEIAEQIRLPDSLGLEFANRGYYGTVHHNTRAVYVKYLGFFDGNPAHLYPLPPVEVGKRYVDAMGGGDAVIVKSRQSYAAGDYRWVAEVLNHLVMAEPDNAAARALLANTLEQLGYQSESAPWRNFYLTGAMELRADSASSGKFAANEGMARGMPIRNLFQAMAVRLNGPKADGKTLHFNLHFSDLETTYLMVIENAVLHAFENKQTDSPSADLTLTSVDFKRMMLGLTTAVDLIADGNLALDGNLAALADLGSLFDQFPRRFPIVTPRPEF